MSYKPVKILFNDFANDPLELREAQARAAREVIDSGWYVLGPKVEAFEAAWASYCGVKGCVGVGNGMDALEIILRCRDIGPGDEVITTGMTAFATVLAILKVGAIPIFADVDPSTALLDIESVKSVIGPRTRAIVLVHLYGQIKGMRAWRSLCDQSNIDLIEDCAQAHGAKEEGIFAGAWGVAGAYSFYPTKNLGCVGDGGAIVSNDVDLMMRAKRIRNYGQSNRYEHTELGTNSRLDEIQAAILLERLAWLDRFNHKRKQLANLYRKFLKQCDVRFGLPLEPPESPESHVYHLMVIKSERRDSLVTVLNNKGIQTIIHYPKPCYLQLDDEFRRRISSTLKVTNFLTDQVLSLPVQPNINDQHLERILQSLLSMRIGNTP